MRRLVNEKSKLVLGILFLSLWACGPGEESKDMRTKRAIDVSDLSDDDPADTDDALPKDDKKSKTDDNPVGDMSMKLSSPSDANKISHEFFDIQMEVANPKHEHSLDLYYAPEAKPEEFVKIAENVPLSFSSWRLDTRDLDEGNYVLYYAIHKNGNAVEKKEKHAVMLVVDHP